MSLLGVVKERLRGIICISAGSRDLAGSRQSAASEFETAPFSRLLPTINDNPLEETVFDIRGQKTSRPKRLDFSDEFANDVATSTQQLRARINLKTDNLLAESENDSLLIDNARKIANQAFEDAGNTFLSRSKSPLMQDAKNLLSSAKFKHHHDVIDEIDSLGASHRAMKTKARLNDLEAEMEEAAERQKSRERRAAALRNLVSDFNSSADESISRLAPESTTSSIQRSSRVKRTEKHATF